MVKRVVSVFLSIVMLTSASLVFAGGPPAAPVPPAGYPAKPCGPGGPAGAPSSYWGDAPLPGICGGIIALPFLVCGSLLGGNTAGPYGPPPAYGPGPGYPPVSYPAKCAPVGPPPCPPAYPQACAPAYPRPCGPGYGPAPAAGGGLTGLACIDLCANLLGMGSGPGLFY